MNEKEPINIKEQSIKTLLEDSSNTEINSNGEVSVKHSQFLKILNKYKIGTNDRIFILLKANNILASFDDISKLIKEDKLFGNTSYDYSAEYIRVRFTKDNVKAAYNEIVLLILDDTHKVDYSTIRHIVDDRIKQYLLQKDADIKIVKDIWKDLNKNDSTKKSETTIIKKNNKDYSQWD